jgi:hypothetical protein
MFSDPFDGLAEVKSSDSTALLTAEILVQKAETTWGFPAGLPYPWSGFY